VKEAERASSVFVEGGAASRRGQRYSFSTSSRCAMLLLDTRYARPFRAPAMPPARREERGVSEASCDSVKVAAMFTRRSFY